MPYPYDDIVVTNRHRSKFEPEYELLDTGIFNDNRLFRCFCRVCQRVAGRYSYSDISF